MPNWRPHDVNLSHTQRVLQMTLLRSSHTRGRTTDESPAKQEQTRKLAVSFATMLNGDLRQPHVQHYCFQAGCCSGRSLEDCMHRILTVFTEAVFARLGSRVP